MSEKTKHGEIQDLLDYVKTETKKSVSEIRTFLNDKCIKYSEDKKEIYKEHDIDNTRKFNFFESISDLYYRENFHSDILEIILNPETKEIGRKYFVEEFVKFVGLTKKEFDCNSDFEVIREKGKIDLLIKNDTQAIIVENKINYAPDMDNQLVRYMKYVDETFGIHNYTVVYLTLIDDPNKKPPLDEYDKKFKEYIDQLKSGKILKEVYAIADNRKKSIERNFLPACIRRLEDESGNVESKYIKDSCNTARVYIEQYRILLNHLGGIEYMNSSDKEVLAEIFSSKEKYDAAYDLMDFLNDKNRVNNVLEDLIKDRFTKEIHSELKHGRKQGCNLNYFENKDNTAQIYFCWDSGYMQIGFFPNDNQKFSKPQQKQFLDIIKKVPRNEYADAEDNWIYCDIENNRSTFIDDVIKGLKILYNGK